MIKSFRGQLLSGTENKIRLGTKQGKIGYRITKFMIINKNVATVTVELMAKIYKISGQTASIFTVDFSDSNLLGMAYYQDNNASTSTSSIVTIFDNEIFNQDIFIVASEGSGSSDPINYYIELEVINLSDNQAAVSTLMDIRSSA